MTLGHIRKVAVLIPVLLVLLVVMGCSSQGKTGKELSVSDVTVYTTVRKTGQYPEKIVVTYSSSLKDQSYKPDDFEMEGSASMWGSSDKRAFKSDFSEVGIEGNKLTLCPKDFPEKYFYVDSFTVTCKTNEALEFTEKEVSKVITPVADDFSYVTAKNGSRLNYHIYEPSDKQDKPVVVVFHGYGDTNNLLTYRTAVAWAEPENQKKRPCYVIAPVIDDMDYFNGDTRREIFRDLRKLLDDMISEGKADPKKIYVMGNSFGGMSTIEFCEQNPDFVAGALALCPALNYSEDAFDKFEDMKDIPIWIAQAENDNTIPSSVGQKAYDRLKELGDPEVRIKLYSDEEMNEAGADASPNSTYSYHHVELAVMEDEEYMKWLFEKLR